MVAIWTRRTTKRDEQDRQAMMNDISIYCRKFPDRDNSERLGCPADVRVDYNEDIAGS